MNHFGISLDFDLSKSKAIYSIWKHKLELPASAGMGGKSKAVPTQGKKIYNRIWN